jgi:ABC-type Na+ efflux pump permease subunit
MIRKLYSSVRWVAYGCGLIALLLITAGNRGAADWTLQAGYLLLIVMFVLFSISYVLFAMLRRR